MSRRTDTFLTTLVLVNVISVTLEPVPQIYDAHEVFFYLEVFSVSIFTFEYLAGLWTTPIKVFENVNFSGIIDLLAILPFYFRSFFTYLDMRILRTLQLL